MIRIGLASCAVAVLLGTAACVGGLREGARVTPWQRLPGSPLSPREMETAHWTGEEVLLIGGSDAPPCPPSASCSAAKTPPLADGAAFDPQTGTWRRIADAPVPFEFARTVQIGDTVYVATPGNDTRPGAPAAFLAYDVGRDRWTELPLPVSPGYEGNIVLAGDRIVSYSMSEEEGERPHMSFDPATGAWSALPSDPLPPSFDRFMAWNGSELLVIAHSLDDVSGETPPIGAAFDPDTAEWRLLPESELHEFDGEFTVEGTFVGPTLSDDDALVAAWATLAHPPEGQEDFGNGAFATALFTPERSYFFRRSGWAYDAASGAWTEIPRLGSDETERRTYVAAGRDLLEFNGIEWDVFDGTFLNETWRWSPELRDPAARP